MEYIPSQLIIYTPLTKYSQEFERYEIKKVIWLPLVLFVITSCSIVPRKEALHVPPGKVEIIDHKYFKVVYDSDRRLAKYVIYELSAEKLKLKNASRKNKFKADPILVARKLPYVLPKEYSRTGYDKGHLAPSADFVWSQEANDLTFLMSNMAPQAPGLNRDAWRRLEERVRRWACGEEKVTIITGPLFSKDMATLASGLFIPQKFFKIVIDETAPRKIIAFVYHQTDKGDVLEQRILKFSELEEVAAINFKQQVPGFPERESRKPAGLDGWKEKDCFH